ncbi:hypothetical protein OCU04_008325 [Sclerotinia nivalis]|uniref:Uncharacterized protein n=1 Tax=Sclerotinia nivalis TaxID=352851 RepID=A0A9X0AIQ5_9HELO|nr:hypothetical protein OCU04_008325 [Sclerotinia nivalis]
MNGHQTNFSNNGHNGRFFDRTSTLRYDIPNQHHSYDYDTPIHNYGGSSDSTNYSPKESVPPDVSAYGSHNDDDFEKAGSTNATSKSRHANHTKVSTEISNTVSIRGISSPQEFPIIDGQVEMMLSKKSRPLPTRGRRSVITEKLGNLIAMGSTNKTLRSEIALHKRVSPDAATLAGGITSLRCLAAIQMIQLVQMIMPSMQPY